MSWLTSSMNLLPASVRATIPPLYASEGNPHPVAQIKLFTPDSQWTWFVIECSPVDDEGYVIQAENIKPADYLLFCLVDGQDRELGYVSLREICTVTGPLGLHVERDLHFKPCRVSEL